MRNERLGVWVLAGVLGCAGGGNVPEPDGFPRAPEPDASPGIGRVDAGVVLAPARLQAVIVADAPPPALSGGTLAVAKDGSVVVAADPDRDLIYVVRPATADVTTLALEKGSEPGRVALDGNGRAHVALRGRGSLVSIELATPKLGTETTVCALPRGVAYDAKKDALVVACAGGELVTLAAADHAKLDARTADLDLRDVIVRADGSLQVSRYRSAELLQVAGGAVTNQGAPTPIQQQRFDSPQPSDARDGKDVPTIEPLPRGPVNVTLSPTLAWRTIAGQDGGTLMLHQASQDDEVVISSSGGYGGGCQTITQPGITAYDAEGKVVNTMTLSPHGLTVDFAVSPDGQFAALAEPGSYLNGGFTLELVQLQGLASRPQDAGIFVGDSGLGGLNDGGIASGPVFFDAGVFGPIQCAGGPGAAEDSQITAVAYDDEGVLYALSREPARLITYEAPPSQLGFPNLIERARVELASASVRDTGHELFHADVGSGLSCAGCHGEALDDGHVWNFRDFGPRRTQTMRGGLLSTLPLHWEGDLANFQNLVDEVMTRRMGGFAVAPKYGNALAAWIDKLPPMKLGSTEGDAAQRGKALFESAEVACSSCHNGTHFTNNQSYDVGTGEKLQVPTLLGIALHPPFMHDGCAATLEERFNASCGGTAHGNTSQLSAAQLSDLISYLKTL